MPLPSRTAREELQDWLRFVEAETHVLGRFPEMVWQQAANAPSEGAVARRADAVQSAGRWQSRPWLRLINRPKRPSACRMTLAHEDRVSAIAVSPDGKTLATAEYETLVLKTAFPPWGNLDDGGHYAGWAARCQCGARRRDCRPRRSAGALVARYVEKADFVALAVDDKIIAVGGKGGLLLVLELRQAKIGARIVTVLEHGGRTFLHCPYSETESPAPAGESPGDHSCPQYCRDLKLVWPKPVGPAIPLAGRETDRQGWGTATWPAFGSSSVGL